MKPDDNTPVPSDGNRRIVQPPTRDRTQQHDAVAQMTREQINQIYTNQVLSEQQASPVEPVEQVHATQSQQLTSFYTTDHEYTPQVLPEEWQHYHSSWQEYYQKYYERYYVGAVGEAQQTYQQHVESLQESHRDLAAQQVSNETMSEDEALHDLRSQLLSKVQTSAKKVRKSRHFVPLISSLLVLMLFAFLQYNSVIFAYAQAYVSPGNIDPQNIIVDPNTSVKVSKEPRLIIPKINVDIGVQYKNTIGSTAQETYDLQMAAMKKGVAYFGFPGANAKPGQNGNFGIAGHSSNDFTDSGAAKFIFAPLQELKKGDTFYINYEGIRYTYSVKKKKVVAPNDVSALEVGTKKPMATLITCTPVGTANSRLLVFGEQISPSPDTAKKAPTVEKKDVKAPEFTGKSPTIFERLFGG